MRGGTPRTDHHQRARNHFNPPTPCGVGHQPQTCRSAAQNFNPPTPCGVGPCISCHHLLCNPISIHPPHAGWDIPIPEKSIRRRNFNPPTPCGVGPMKKTRTKTAKKISIHPPHAGWDYSPWNSQTQMLYFNPPTPCGVGRNHVRL